MVRAGRLNPMAIQPAVFAFADLPAAMDAAARAGALQSIAITP
jgi:hypothetical protein